MNTLGHAALGTVFLLISASLTFLMFYLWGFPFDHEKLRSDAPPALMQLHRILGYVYVGIYIYFMIEMIPRMWTYQIELPARTVAHMLLGMAIGAILIVKIVIVRFYKYLESTLVPGLGTLLFICTVLLTGLALPPAYREHALSANALGERALTPERQTLLRAQLSAAGIAEASRIDRLLSRRGLSIGRSVLVSRCVQCHDLRTVLARPRTPEAWRQTVERMASRSVVLEPISPEEQAFVTAYLISISPTLQHSAKLQRQLDAEQSQTLQALNDPAPTDSITRSESPPFDENQAAVLFASRCSQCHDNKQVERAPPATAEEAQALVERMVRNGLVAPADELDQIVRYLQARFVE